jgi:hypothetical protein
MPLLPLLLLLYVVRQCCCMLLLWLLHPLQLDSCTAAAFAPAAATAATASRAMRMPLRAAAAQLCCKYTEAGVIMACKVCQQLQYSYSQIQWQYMQYSSI